MNISESEKEQILQEYKDMVRAKSHLYFMLGADKEDIVQEGMIGLFKAIESYDETKGSSFKTYADICVNRQIITAIKSASRKKHEVLNGAVSLDKPVSEDEKLSLGESLSAGSDTDPEELLILSEMTELILSPKSTLLSDMEREVVKRMMDGKDYKQIASELDKSPKSIDNAMQRIRTKLKKFFAE